MPPATWRWLLGPLHFSLLSASPTYRTSAPFPVGRMPLVFLALYIGLSLMLTFVHAINVNTVPRFNLRREHRHVEIVELRGKAPYGYRLAVPMIAEQIRRGLERAGLSVPKARETAYLSLRWAFTLAGLLLFHAFLSAWFSAPWALAGTLLFAALHPASYHHYWYQPASALDFVLWLLAARLAQTRASAWWLLPIVIVGAFNRETIVFAPLVYMALACGCTPLWKVVIPVGAALAAWAIVFLGLRLWIVGPLQRIISMSNIVRANCKHPLWVAYALVFLGVLWVLPVTGWRRVRPELQRLVLVMVPYFLLQCLFARIQEVRVLLPMTIALIPVALDILRVAAVDSGEAQYSV
jgi:hypothetical protein